MFAISLTSARKAWLLLTMTGGNSAVRVLDSTECSIDSSPSALFVVRLELERSLVAAWLSVRLRANGIDDETLPLCRTDACTFQQCRKSP